MTVPPYNPPPPVKQGKGPLFWIALGCGGCATGLAIFAVLVVAIAMTAMRQAAPVRDAVQRATTDPRVVTALGAPVQPGWFLSGNVNTENDSGHANVRVRLEGSKAKGSLHVVAAKTSGRWVYETMTVTPEGGAAIDLLGSE